MHIKLKQGVLGRWRWFIYSHNGKRYRGGGRVWGFKKDVQAAKDAIDVFSDQIRIEHPEWGPMYGGPRELDTE